MQKKVVILGGGVIGMFSAYYLAKEGHAVTLLDKGKVKGASSTGNAGMIVPSHVIPLAAPGMIAKGVRWMLSSKSPFYVKPRLNKELFGWGWDFYRSANQEHVNASTTPLRDISLFSKKLYAELHQESSAFEYEEKGLLMLFQSEKVGAEECEAGRLAQELGLEVSFLDQSGLKDVGYNAETNALGAVLYKSDAHLQPNKLMAFLKKELERLNVQLVENVDIIAIEKQQASISAVRTKDEVYRGDMFVVAAGAWSAELAKLGGDSIRLLPGKGYSFTLPKSEKAPTIPTILCEGKVAVTPFDSEIRFGGTMEITHVRDQKVNMNRVKGIVDTIERFYPELGIEMPQEKDIWMGFRPCSPTGLPYIGRSPKSSNLLFATGHGMMGLSLGPATGMLVKEMVEETQTSIDVAPYGLKL